MKIGPVYVKFLANPMSYCKTRICIKLINELC